jgi:hypothetical protein
MLYFLPLEEYPPRCGFLQPGDDFRCGGLATARLAYQTDRFMRQNIKRHPIDGPDMAFGP